MLCHSALVTLGLSCKFVIFLIGRRILSIVIVFSLKSNTAPILCSVCLPINRSYKGAVAPASFYTMSGVRWTDLLSEYSMKERVTSPTLFVLKVPFEVPHDCGTARFIVGMYF